MLVLGVETSCDETGLALVRDGKLLSEALASQTDMHAVFGGVVPEIASREHLRTLPILLRQLLAKAEGVIPGRGMADIADITDIDAVAVARGPGLLGALLVGLSFAKGLCLGTGARLIGVNHLHAHLLAPGLEADLSYPALGLLVSGGHTHLYHMAGRMDGPTQFRLLGRTLDDAAGEAFDKVAKMLNFPYPGGRHVDRLAQRAEPDPDLFPRPYLDNSNLDFSFSGLKTAASQHIAAHPELRLPVMAEPRGTGEGGDDRLARVCASLNLAVADTLRVKVERALAQFPGMRGLILAGGVAANTMIREAMARVAQQGALHFMAPPAGLCTDNGAMIAYAGWVLAEAGLRHGLDLDAIPRGRAVPWDYQGMAAG